MRIDPLIIALRALTESASQDSSVSARMMLRRRAAVQPRITPPLAEFSRYDLLSPVERQRQKWREYRRKRTLFILHAFRIPRRKKMHALMMNGDRVAGRWWGHYEMSCIRNKRMKALGYPNLRKARAVVEAGRERRKREAEARIWANSM